MNRIDSGYCPGMGDGGNSRFVVDKPKTAKASSLTDFYLAAEQLQNQISFLLLFDRMGGILAKSFLLKLPFVRSLVAALGITPFTNREAIEVLSWLEEALAAFQAYFYSKGVGDRHRFPEEFSLYLNKYTMERREAGESSDFQRFSNHLNLAVLNKLRISARNLESSYLGAIAYLTENGQLQDETNLLSQAAIINRLSTYLWVVTQEERKSLGSKAKIWRGFMPAFIFEIR